jgi:hypothetical protein
VAARISTPGGTVGYFTPAARPTMIMPIAVLGVGVLSCLAVKGGTRPTEPSDRR